MQHSALFGPAVEVIHHHLEIIICFWSSSFRETETRNCENLTDYSF